MSDPLLSIGMGGDSGAADRLSAFDSVALLTEWGKEWGPKVTDAIKAVTPVAAEDGGALLDSITFGGVKPVSGGVSMEWTTDKFYAEYLIKGTQAHGTTGGHLFMRWFSGGAPVFARWVSGIEPNTFPLSSAVEDLLPVMNASLAEIFEGI